MIFVLCSFLVGSIGGCVFNDANGNGSQDPGEPGIPNVIVLLSIDSIIDAGDGVAVSIDITDAFGKYSFSDLTLNTTHCVRVPLAQDPLTGFAVTAVNSPNSGVNVLKADYGFRKRK